LNLSRQLQKVHDLGDTGPRSALPGDDSGLVELNIVLHLLAPRLCQLARMQAQFLHPRPFLGRGGEVLQDVGWIEKWMDDEWLCAPPRKGYADRQTKIPAGSDFSRACGAISVLVQIRNPRFANLFP
jgi:hypothetical protein